MAIKLFEDVKNVVQGATAARKARASARQTKTEEQDKILTLKNLLNTYKAGKADHDDRIIEDDRWYRNEHWEVLREQAQVVVKKGSTEPEPVTAFLFNTIANRHGDLMDAYPEPVMMEREESDKEEADRLSKITKVVLERNKFRREYSANGYSKVKGGTACYHIGWDTSLENGLGDIAVRRADILRLYWEPGVSDVQDSPYLFALSLADPKQLRQLYPDLEDDSIDGTGGVELKVYSEADKNILDGKTLVIDCYSKEAKPPFARPVLHLDKIIGNKIVDSSRDKRPQGLYDHGKYPFAFDALFPLEHSVLGFGYVDIVKSPQLYIDRLDQILLKNAMVSGKQRVLYKDGGGIPGDKLADMSLDFIACTGNLKENEDYAILQGKPLSPGIIQHRQSKIAELKEVSGANDFNRGSTGGGVTAASAIMALQEAGNKLARDMVASTYDCFTEICNQVIELIAQFYTEPRKFRITQPNGDPEYIEYTNAGLQPPPTPAQDPTAQAAGVEPVVRKPVFDIVVHAEKYSPYAALATNELAKELFAAGFFLPDAAPAALIALDLMSFDGKDRIVKKITETYQQTMAMQQAQAQAQQSVGTNQEIMLQMNEYIKQLTGKDMLAGANIGQGGAPQ